MLTQRSNDHNFEDERHDDDGNLWPGGQVQVPPGEEQTPPCSQGGSQTTVNKEETMSKSLVNKTQRQLCKRLAGPFIPFSWSEKEFHFGCDH